jgi:hypothetical protein
VANPFEVIKEIMTDKKFEMMYPYQDVQRLQMVLVKVHEHKETVSCTKEEYMHYESACKLFGLKPHPQAA